MEAQMRRRSIRRIHERRRAIDQFMQNFNVPALVQEVAENNHVVEEQELPPEPNVPEHRKVNKILGFEENNVTNGRDCDFLTCNRFADYKCNLLKSGEVRSYCYKCFERFRTHIVYCDADTTQTCE